MTTWLPGSSRHAITASSWASKSGPVGASARARRGVAGNRGERLMLLPKNRLGQPESAQQQAQRRGFEPRGEREPQPRGEFEIRCRQGVHCGGDPRAAASGQAGAMLKFSSSEITRGAAPTRAGSSFSACGALNRTGSTPSIVCALRRADNLAEWPTRAFSRLAASKNHISKSAGFTEHSQLPGQTPAQGREAGGSRSTTASAASSRIWRKPCTPRRASASAATAGGRA